MGADFYESANDKQFNKRKHLINVGIDENVIIKNSIIDKNSRIGKNCKIINKNNLQEYDGKNYYIREGVVIVPKNSVIENNTEI